MIIVKLFDILYGMNRFFLLVHAHYKLLTLLIVLSIISGVFFFNRDTTPNWTTDTVSQGSVSQLISISGTVDAVGTAALAFPVGGTLESIVVKEGDYVTQGQVLATLVHDALKAEYQDAYATLLIAQADLRELTDGLRPEERDVAQTTAAIAEAELKRVTEEQNDRVTSAYRTLLSSGLEAVPLNKDTTAQAPIITGTYTCDEGTYLLQMYRSGSVSGYSYRLSGIEQGLFTAYTETSAPLGTCGLNIQFIPGSNYNISTWKIEIPNTKSSTYVTNSNAYTLALTQQKNAVSDAEGRLTLAQQNLTLATADPRTEARSRSEARVLQAEARLSAVTARIQDTILTAPFDGIITNTRYIAGETVTNAPLLTLLSRDSFTITALIPEIDITKVTFGQKADIVFDARQNERLSATITFISPLAEKIDGVSYFKATLVLDSEVAWLRSGLNADIDIIVEREDNVLRIPRRYLREENGTYTVLTPQGTEATPRSVEVVFIGNDGFVAIRGLSLGDTVIAP